MAVDTRGRIWVSYFDEGICGNFGWGHPGPHPLGASGLNCFDDDGSVIWSFPVDNDTGPMTECYALNVQDNGAAAYTYYSEFRLCRISADFQIECFDADLQGCRQFAISEHHVLFTGQWNDAMNAGYLGRLIEGRVSDVEQVEFTLPGGRPLTEGQFIGRGERLHFFSDESWYSLSLAEQM